ncbi:23S rRNA (adenine(1618)-N(6))-methyltransferase RlmF [Thalassotalea ponticola]|uniref:23S rRNA (adenine(1618)-N(6))-methyltransferase RlmF n=1 Tax=Thalassotalea ponticola TaxID=1523392 RepID=UPI0025B62666|nr:23S rRNA (adenine(1618)-N(6))-methyltransferase RlmF [Thalassotalea ponticola]MDN3651792.1 23S rRNA (adenine(1618)-N(6))-methyltransferase RlmF [Thalassotalea ponticola]
MHSRNLHQGDYDFKQLIEAEPKLAPLVVNKGGKQTIDFSNNAAVVLLNRALLKHHYQISYWHLPQGHLCPPIPGRVDYIHYLADILKRANDNTIAKHPTQITLLDIGTGASVIYPLLAHRVYGWQVIASDIAKTSLNNAQTIIDKNQLSGAIQLRHQVNSNTCFNNVIKPGELIDMTICNPPFFDSLAQARQANQRKWQKLAKHTAASLPADNFNFGGKHNELHTSGGELKFIRRMVNESKYYGQQVMWFTTLVSNKDNVSQIKRALKKVNPQVVEVVKMAQGHKISRFVAWSFMSTEQQRAWCEQRNR